MFSVKYLNEPLIDRYLMLNVGILFRFFAKLNLLWRKRVWQRNSENETQEEQKKNNLENYRPSLFKHSEFLSQSCLILLISGRRRVEKKDRPVVCPAFPDACCLPTPVWWLSCSDENP